MKTLRVTLADIIGPTGTPNSTATVHARYVDTSGRGRDVHLTDGTIVVPVRRVAAADGDPEVFDFDVYANDVAPVREVDYGHLVEVSWTVTAPTGAKSSGVKRVQITDSMASVVQLGLLATPTPVPPYTGGYVLPGELDALDARVVVLEEAPGGGGGGAVDSVNGQTGTVVLNAASVGAATTAQGAKADSAVQPADLTAYATDAELTAGLATKAATSHSHATSDVTGLDAALAGKAATSHTHTASQVSDSTTTGRALLTAVDATAARTTLALGTAATTAATAYATAAQGTAADAALAASAAPELIRDTMATALARAHLSPMQLIGTPIGTHTPILGGSGFTTGALSTTTQNSQGYTRLTPITVFDDSSFDRIGVFINTAATDAGATIGFAVYSQSGELILDCGEESALTTGLKTRTINLGLSRGIYFTALRFRANTYAGANPAFFWSSVVSSLAMGHAPDTNNCVISLDGFTLLNENAFPSQITTWTYAGSGNPSGAPINILRRAA